MTQLTRIIAGIVVGLPVLAQASPFQDDLRAFIVMGDDPFFFSYFDGTVHSSNNDEFPFGDPVISHPGYLNNMSGGDNGGATGNVNIASVPFGTLQFVGLAINIADFNTDDVPHRLSSDNDPALGHIVADLNNSARNYGYTAYAFNNVPQSYAGVAAALLAGESAYGGQPFDIFVAENFPFPSFDSRVWGFDFSEEIESQQDGISAIRITDVGDMPEPGAMIFFAFLGSATPGQAPTSCRRLDNLN